jgi:hypothetical protein
MLQKMALAVFLFAEAKMAIYDFIAHYKPEFVGYKTLFERNHSWYDSPSSSGTSEARRIIKISCPYVLNFIFAKNSHNDLKSVLHVYNSPWPWLPSGISTMTLFPFPQYFQWEEGI